MKKFYSLMAMALVTGLTVSAKYDAGVAQTFSLDRELSVSAIEQASESMTKAPASTNGTGYFMWNSTSFFKSGTGKGSIQVQINGSEAIVTGLFEMWPAEGKYDAAKGTIDIPLQETWYTGRESQEDQNPKPIWFLPGRLTTDAEGKITGRQPKESVTLYYVPEGVQVNGQLQNVGGWVLEEPADYMLFAFESEKSGTTMEFSGFAGDFNNFFPVIGDVYPDCPAFEFNSSEWEDAGKAKLTDGWFKALTGSGYAAYDVDLMRNKANKNHFLLVNPYGANSPYAGSGETSNTTPDAEGYIYVNMDNKDAVLIRPFVNSGYSSDYVFGGGNVTCTSYEGYKFYIEGYGYADLIDESEMFGDPLSKLDSNYVLSIPRCRIQYPYRLRNNNEWQTSDGKAIPMESSIAFPAAAFAGVEGVINDTENVAKRYFNLQGVEIANPEAGQVVIVKEGNKTSKTIVR